jgi:hypothetical protein
VQVKDIVVVFLTFFQNVDGSLKACFITAFKDYRQEFKESFPELDEIKYFIRKPKAIEDLVNHVATILG